MIGDSGAVARMSDARVFKRDRIVVWSSDLDRLISDRYERPYSMLATGEYSQGSYREISVDEWQPDTMTAQEAQDSLSDWLALPVPADGDWQALMDYESRGPDIDVILWDLCRTELIESGTYLITVWW